MAERVGPLRAADDMVRIITNGLTFGLADQVASALGEKDTAAKTAAARQRAGIAGDAASVLGMGGGAKLAFQGLKQLPRVAKAAFSKKGAALAGLGFGTAVAHNARTGTQAPKAKPVSAQAKGQPARKKLAGADRVADNISASLQAMGDAPPTFAGMAQQLADQQGGNLSLRQLAALAEVTQRSTPRTGRAPQPGDAAGRMLEDMYITQFNKALTDPNADPVQAQDEFEQKILQLRKTRFNNFADEFGLDEGQ